MLPGLSSRAVHQGFCQSVDDGCARMPGSSEEAAVLATVCLSDLTCCVPSGYATVAAPASEAVAPRLTALVLFLRAAHRPSNSRLSSGLHSSHLLGFLAYVQRPSLSFAHSLLQGLSWGQLRDAVVDGQALSRPCETS